MYDIVVVLKEAYEVQEQSRARRKLKQILENCKIDLSRVTVTHPDALALTVERHQPNVIVTMGADAYQAACKTKEPLGVSRGELRFYHEECMDCDALIDEHRNSIGPVFHEDQDLIKLVPTYHPNFLEDWRNQEVMEWDFRKADSISKDKKLPLLMGEYEVITDLDALRGLRDYIKTSKYCAFDAETEGFNTFENDEILCIQFSTRAGEGFVVPLRGAWRRHEVDTYSDWQLENYFWRWAKHKDGTIEKVLSKTETGAIKVSSPVFPAGSIVCSTPDKHTDKKPSGHFCRGILTDVWTPEERLEVIAILKEIFEESSCIFVAHNGKFDQRALLWQLGIHVRHFLFDTILAYHQFHEEHPHNLEYTRSRFTFFPNYDKELKSYLPKEGASFAMVPNEVLWKYGAADADLERRLVEIFIQQIKLDNPENGMWIFNNIDMPYNRALFRVEQNGMKIDMVRFKELSNYYNKAIETLKVQIDEMLHEHNLTPIANYNNSGQLRALLFEGEYETITTPERKRKCRPCKGEGCDKCTDGYNVVEAEVKKVCRGMNFPSYLVPKTDKGDDEKTDKKAFGKLLAYCAEDVLYSRSESKGRIFRKATEQPLSEREVKTRTWKRQILKRILEYKQAIQARNLFLEGDPEKANDEQPQAMLAHIKYDGKIHQTFKQLTTSARLSTSDPNSQNIANEDDEFDDDKEKKLFHGYGIRTMFVPDDTTRVLLDADYSSQEMRILAYLANEQNLMDVFMVCPQCKYDFRPREDNPELPFEFRRHCERTGHKAQDLHQGTASKVFKVDYNAVVKQQRTFAKRVNFGLNYGQGVSGLADTLSISMREAGELIEEYMASFPGIRDFQAYTKKIVQAGGKIPNAYGRWRHTYGVREMKGFADDEEYRRKVSAKERVCINYPVQSSPADIMGNVAIALYDLEGVRYEDWKEVEAHVIAHDLFGFHPSEELEKMGAKMVNLVHDNTAWDIGRTELKEASEIIQTTMERIPWKQLNWFLPVDVSYGPRWGVTEK